ncbi:MAG TPA: type I phosphomannose isomerase catalytic subunit [Bacteroidales bacterium]|nr:type I phosphomannose isomerase catalytic subunit [Bacteroidales bacterium]
MAELYPLKFEPVLVDKIWGGNSLALRWGKNADTGRRIGESWEISGVPGNISVVSNGYLAGNNLQEIIEVYMGDITGDSIYEKYENEFPLLIKLIEAEDDLSVQVHPGDLLARERHGSYGKTEMWYILESRPGAKIFTGFSREVSRDKFLEAIGNNTLNGLLNTEASLKGDVYFTPAGRIHAIGAGNILAEIQQTSDITYRIYDWNRKNADGTGRELHTALSLDAIDFTPTSRSAIRKEIHPDTTVNLVSCEYFITNLLHFSSIIRKDYSFIDSFMIYICASGELLIHWDGGVESLKKGETILVPAMLNDIVLEPRPEAEILEVFVNSFIN